MTRNSGAIMKFRLVTAAALVTLAALGSAGAADLPPPVYKSVALPPPAPVYNWTGCYVGGGGGYESPRLFLGAQPPGKVKIWACPCAPG
jgi:opacity protein-like surface antigen